MLHPLAVVFTGSSSRGLNWCKVSQRWDTNSRLALQPLLHKQVNSPDKPTVSEIAAGQYASTDCTIFPADVPAFSRSPGSSLLTLCRLAVGGFGFVRGHAGPRLGLHVNAVHILENRGKPRTVFTVFNTNIHSTSVPLILTVHAWVSRILKYM